MLSRSLKSLLIHRRAFRARRFRARYNAPEGLESRQLLSAVTVQLGASQDTTIYAANPEASNGSGEFLLAGDGTRGLVRFDVGGGSIPDGSTIIDAVLTMSLAGSHGGAAAVSVHRVDTAWGESGSNAPGDESSGAPAQQFDATWQFAAYGGALWQGPGGDFQGTSASTSVDGIGSYEWFGGGLIDDVQGWLDDSATNFGWLISLGGSGLKSFVSKDGPDAGLAPTLEITYEEPPEPPAFVEGRIWNDLNGDGIQTDALLSQLKLEIIDGNTHFNGFGGREHWFKSTVTGKWYFLTKDGTLTQWSSVRSSLTGTRVGTVDPKFYLEPGLVPNSVGDPEPWLNGWTVELLNESGELVDTTLTHGIDVNADGVIDPIAEGGWYRFVVFGDAEYSVRQVLPDGWTENVKVVYDTADSTVQAVNSGELRFRNSYYENFGGLGEKWVYSDQTGWHFITPSGDLYRWDGIRITVERPLQGVLIAALGTKYFQDPELLWTSGAPESSSGDNELNSRTDFGNFRAHTVRGRVWLDFFADGVRGELAAPPVVPTEELAAEEAWLFDEDNRNIYIVGADGQIRYWGTESDAYGDESPGSSPGTSPVQNIEPWLNGRIVQLVDGEGVVVASVETTSVDLNENGTIEFETERGWYIFENVPVGDYTVRTVVDQEWIQTAPVNAAQTLAATLDATHDFRRTASDFHNWGGLNEKWVIDRQELWYYILPDGNLYQWEVGSRASNGGLRGNLVGTLSPQHYADLRLLTDPDLSAVQITVDGETDTLELLFGNHRILESLL